MFKIREGAPHDLPFLRAWLSEALGGTPAAKFLIATEVATGEIVGAAALRVFIDSVGRFLLYVDSPFRRRGCGAALLDAVQHMASRAGVRLLLTGRSFTETATDDSGLSSLAFFRARGLTAAQEIVRFRSEVKPALAVLDPIYQRCELRLAKQHNIRVVTADQVDARSIAEFAVRHVGGLPEEVAARLGGQGRAYSLPTSIVAHVNGKVVGVLLSVLSGQHAFVETRAVDAAYRGGPLNVALMYRSIEAGSRMGYDSFEFEADAEESDTHKLAKRFGAARVGQSFCWAAPVPVTDHVPAPQTPAPAAIRSCHTVGFAEILDQMSLSLAVTTAQAGKLVLLRPDGRQINTHFRSFDRPMGLAVNDGRLAVGTALEIWEFHDAPAAATRLEPAGRHDACYLPRGSQTTGDIHIHDLAWAGEELWFVNTRFSCLCTRDLRYSFVPRWRPPFVSALAPEDRCHLNGFCLAPDRGGSEPCWYASALGTADTPGGWRETKGNGGVVIDTSTNEILVRGLSMPHSPRWYDGRLWLLESGTGTFGVVDLRVGRYEPVAELPGFTRGLAFWGRYAFVGLSKMRHGRLNGTVQGIPIAARAEAGRSCGVWVVDIVTGRVVAWLRFDEGVQEVFAVEVLPNRKFPDLINHAPRMIADAFVLPDSVLTAGAVG